MSDEEPKIEYCAYLMAAPDYVFEEVKELTFITANDRTSADQIGNEYISQIIIRDDKYFRLIYTTSQGFNIVGYDDLNEASRRDRERTLFGDGADMRREPFLLGALLAGIKRGVFTRPGRLDEFLREGAKFLNGELPIMWPHDVIAKIIEETSEKEAARGLVKIPQKLEKSKVFLSLIDQQLSLALDDMQLQTVRENNIDLIGMDLDVTEDNCLFAIQALLSDADFRPNWKNESKKIGFSFTVPAFLNACGVTKTVNKYGKMEFDSYGRRDHLRGLDRLSKRFFVIVHETERNEKGEKYRMKSVTPLWRLHTLMKVTKTGRELVQGYAITDYKDTLELDIKKYFLLMPRTIKATVRELTGRRHTRGHDRFISYLFVSANEKRRLEAKGQAPEWTIELTHTTIMRRAEFAAAARGRHYDHIWRQWGSYLSLAQEMGYITAWRTEKGQRDKKEVIELNRKKFSEIWANMEP